MRRRIGLKAQSWITTILFFAGFLLLYRDYLADYHVGIIFLLYYALMILAVLLEIFWLRCPECGQWVPFLHRGSHVWDHFMDKARNRMRDERDWMVYHDWMTEESAETRECHYDKKLKRFVWKGISCEKLDAAMKEDPLVWEVLEVMPGEETPAQEPQRRKRAFGWTLEWKKELPVWVVFFAYLLFLSALPVIKCMDHDSLLYSFLSGLLVWMLLLSFIVGFALWPVLLRCPFCHALLFRGRKSRHGSFIYYDKCPGCGETIYWDGQSSDGPWPECVFEKRKGGRV